MTDTRHERHTRPTTDPVRVLLLVAAVFCAAVAVAAAFDPQTPLGARVGAALFVAAVGVTLATLSFER